MNRHAQALGRLGKGRKKTLSEHAITQRRHAARKSVEKRLENKLKKPIDITETLP